MSRYVPNSRYNRQQLRAASTEDNGKGDTPRGLYTPNSAAQRRILQELGGRGASKVGTRAYRRAMTYMPYVLGGRAPSLIAHFKDNVYAYRPVGRDFVTAHTRHGLITSGRSTTMIVRDEDGIYKHGAHNLYRNGAGGAQAITVVSGRDYTIRMKGTGSITYSGAASGTLNGTGTTNVVRVEVTAASTTLTVTPSGNATEIAVYQSDLGGMQLTSDGTDYVENNTGAALYAAPVEYDVNGVRSLPIWEARTNGYTRNDDPTAVVIASGGTGTAGALSALGLSFMSFVEDTSTGLHRVQFPVIATASGPVTIAVTMKAIGSRRIYLNCAVAIGARALFDLSSGTIVATNGGTANIEPLGDGYYRLSVSGSYAATSAWFIQACEAGHTTASDDSYTGDGASGFYIAAIQEENGLGASPYIPTYGSTATRAADNLYTLASAFGYRQTEGTIVAEFESVGSDGVDFPSIAFLHDGSANNRIALNLTTGNAAYADARAGGAAQAGFSLGSYTPNGQSRVAIGTKQDSFAGSLDGATVATDSSGSHPSGITTLQYGRSDTGQHLNGKLYSLVYYPFRAANSDLEAASA